jgi:hypothetical protein
MIDQDRQFISSPISSIELSLEALRMHCSMNDKDYTDEEIVQAFETANKSRPYIPLSLGVAQLILNRLKPQNRKTK